MLPIYPPTLRRITSTEYWTDHFSVWTQGKKGCRASGMFSDLSPAGEKGFPWHWHWVNKALCYSFCRPALVGGVHIHQWGVLARFKAPEGFAQNFAFRLQQLFLQFHPQLTLMQLFNRWISSNSFSAFNSHLLKLEEQENHIFQTKILRKTHHAFHWWKIFGATHIHCFVVCF